MIKRIIGYITIVAIACGSVYLFPRVAAKPLTFIDMSMNPEQTIKKYENIWDDTTIKTMPDPKVTYENGDIIGTITIPSLNIYELPIYYGSNYVNNNWQITAPGHLGNWGIPGEPEPTCIGSHNYQLFHDLPTLEIGDKYIIETGFDTYVYVVTGTDIYDHLTDNWSDKTYNSKAPYTVDLMTCYPIALVETNDMYIVTTEMQKGTQFIRE